MLCIKCSASLPETNFHWHANNPVEKLFWGRLPLAAAAAQYYFTKESLMQHLMHQFKYKGNKELGLQLGRMMGQQLLQSNRFINTDALVPLPLFPSKEKKRGYNQATVLCEGMSEIMKIPVLKNAAIRTAFTETQTRKGRIARWQNMENKFVVLQPEKISGKSLLLVDDVVTTGATLEACGNALLQAGDVRLSVVTLCMASR
jgi:ComF family protein